jgi:hypothetical protein
MYYWFRPIAESEGRLHDRYQYKSLKIIVAGAILRLAENETVPGSVKRMLKFANNFYFSSFFLHVVVHGNSRLTTGRYRNSSTEHNTEKRNTFEIAVFS